MAGLSFDPDHCHHCRCCSCSCFCCCLWPSQICFVGDAGFRDLSRRDPAATQLLSEAMDADKSGEWFAKRAEREARMVAKGV